MAKRAHTKSHIETQVLTASARRCSLCFGIDHDYSEKPGQIAHVDGDRSNSAYDNLAWLCLDHHDRYDGRTTQSKGITQCELKEYRQRLYDEVDRVRAAASTVAADAATNSASSSVQQISSDPESLRNDVRVLLAQINPEIMDRIDAGESQIDTMISVPKLMALHQLSTEPGFADFLIFNSTGNTILGGFGNRIGNAINDANEGGMLQGIMLFPTAELAGNRNAGA